MQTSTFAKPLLYCSTPASTAVVSKLVQQPLQAHHPTPNWQQKLWSQRKAPCASCSASETHGPVEAPPPKTCFRKNWATKRRDKGLDHDLHRCDNCEQPELEEGVCAGRSTAAPSHSKTQVTDAWGSWYDSGDDLHRPQYDMDTSDDRLNTSSRRRTARGRPLVRDFGTTDRAEKTERWNAPFHPQPSEPTNPGQADMLPWAHFRRGEGPFRGCLPLAEWETLGEFLFSA